MATTTLKNKKRRHRSTTYLLDGAKQVDADDWQVLLTFFQTCRDRQKYQQYQQQQKLLRKQKRQQQVVGPNTNTKTNQDLSSSSENDLQFKYQPAPPLTREQLDDLSRAIKVTKEDKGFRIVSLNTPTSLLGPVVSDEGDDDSQVSSSLYNVQQHRQPQPPQLQPHQQRTDEEKEGKTTAAGGDGEEEHSRSIPPPLPYPTLAGLECLKRLHLGGRHMHPTIPSNLCGVLPQLEELYLAYSHQQDLPEDLLIDDDGVSSSGTCTFTTNLKTLDLSGCTSLKRLPANLGKVLAPTLNVLAVNLGLLESIPESMRMLENLHTLYCVGRNNNNDDGHDDRNSISSNSSTSSSTSSNNNVEGDTVGETPTGRLSTTRTQLSIILPQWTKLRRLYIGMNDLLGTLPESVLPVNTMSSSEEDAVSNKKVGDEYGGWQHLEEIYVTMDVSRTLWNLRSAQRRRERGVDEPEAGPAGGRGRLAVFEDNDDDDDDVLIDMDGINDDNNNDSDSDAERPYNPCNTILVNALTDRIAKWKSLRKIHFNFLWLYGPFLPVPTANDRVTIPLTLLHPLSNTLQALSIFCGPSNGNEVVGGVFDTGGAASMFAPPSGASEVGGSSTTSNVPLPPPVPLVELVLQDIGSLVCLKFLSLSHCKLVAPPPPSSPPISDVHHGAGTGIGSNPGACNISSCYDSSTHNNNSHPIKPRLTEFRLQCCFQFFTASRACEFVASNLDMSELRVFQLTQCHEALGDSEFHRLCVAVLNQCPQLVEVDLSDGNIFHLDVGGPGDTGLDDDCNLLLSCLPPTLQVLELSRNPALCPSENGSTSVDGTTKVNRRNMQALWFLVARFPFLGFVGRFNILFLGRLGETYGRLDEYYRLIHHLTLNRARLRILSGTLHATDVPVALWPLILHRSQRAYDDYPNHVLARNRKEEPDAIFHLLRERGAEDIFPLAAGTFPSTGG